MKKKQSLKPKFTKVFVFIFVILIFIYLFATISFLKIPNYTTRFWNEFNDIKIYSLSNKTFDEYELHIKEEIKYMNHRYGLQKAYFALGYIEGIKYNFEESNNYYYQAISIDPDVNSSFLSCVYTQLAVNNLALDNLDEAESYFQKALQTTNSSDLKLRVYQIYTKGLLFHTDEYYRVTDLMNVINGLTHKPDQKIHSLILYSDISMILGQYEQGIQSLIQAFEISVEIKSSKMQREIANRLSNLYYLTGDYNQVIKILHSNVLSLESENILQYLKTFVNSLQYVYDYKAAMTYLDTFESQIIDGTQEGEAWAKLYCLILKADLAIKGENLEIGLDFLQQAYMLYNNVNDSQLLWWMQKIYLDSLVLEGMHGERIILKYVELYHLIENSDIFYYTKLDLLDEIAAQNRKLGNYVLAYEYLNQRQNKFKTMNKMSSAIDLEEVYEQVKVESKKTQIKQRIEVTLLSSFLFITVGMIVHALKKHRRHLKWLGIQMQRNDYNENLTQTLTKESLYESLQTYIGQGNEFTFIVLQYDHFKRYNEVYGYLSGDEVLKILAKHIKEIFDNEYVSRHLGNQFIIVSYHSKEACVPNLMLLMQTIYDLNLENSTDLKDGRLTISAGISSGVLDSEGAIDQQIRLATKNLEKSRQRGNNKFTGSSN